MLILAIFAGGFIGAIARFGVSGWVYRRFGSDFPWGTLAVNVLGTFLLGALLPLVAEDEIVAGLEGFLVVGTLGGFTTFSTFAYETVMLVEDGETHRAGAYVLASVLLGLASLAVGSFISLRLL